MFPIHCDFSFFIPPALTFVVFLTCFDTRTKPSLALLTAASAVSLLARGRLINYYRYPRQLGLNDYDRLMNRLNNDTLFIKKSDKVAGFAATGMCVMLMAVESGSGF